MRQKCVNTGSRGLDLLRRCKYADAGPRPLHGRLQHAAHIIYTWGYYYDRKRIAEHFVPGTTAARIIYYCGTTEGKESALAHYEA